MELIRERERANLQSANKQSPPTGGGPNYAMLELNTDVGANMNELVPYEGLYYQLIEAKGKFFCVIIAEGEDVAVWKSKIFENPELAITDAKRFIDEFNEHSGAVNLDIAKT